MAPYTHTVSTDELHAIIDGSVLIMEDRKAMLLELLPHLDEAGKQELKTLLLSEDNTIRSIAKQAIERAVKANDSKFLEELDALIHGCMKLLRESEEHEATKVETTTVEHFFDDAP